MADTSQSKKALRDASLHAGIVGALAFIIFIMIFREDWTSRFEYLRYLLPTPIIALLLAKWFPLPGSLLFLSLGIGAAVFDFYFTPEHPGLIAGRGLGYTLVFVTLPLVCAGIAHQVLWWKYR